MFSPDRLAHGYATSYIYGASCHGCDIPKPFTVLSSNFKDKPVHLPGHTALNNALAMPASVMSVSPASPEVVKTKEREMNGNEGTTGPESAKMSENEARVDLDGDTV